MPEESNQENNEPEMEEGNKKVHEPGGGVGGGEGEMEAGPTPSGMNPSKSMWIAIVLVVLIVLGVWLWRSSQVPAPPAQDTATTTEETATSGASEGDLGEDDTSDIQGQLEGINVEDVEREFQQIDEDLENLEE